jgi:hypothetical protein
LLFLELGVHPPRVEDACGVKLSFQAAVDLGYGWF